MSQHFLLSSAARSLSLAKVARMSDEEAHDAFRLIRWAETRGEPVCPRCRFFSRLRRAQIGTHHHFNGRYLGAYASEMAWREDNRRISNGELYLMASNAALAHSVSRQWKGYWQR
jgi:ISXO2-like transposase domain